MEHEYLLEMEHVSISYRQEVVRDVSLGVQEGEILVLAGESGCGKTTLLNAVLGLPGTGVSITGGCIKYNGKNLTDMSLKERRKLWGREITMIYQDPGAAFNPIRSYRRQFGEMLKSHGISGREMSCEKILECFGKLGLPQGERILESCPYEMSGGMNQRIAIAAAMFLKPRLLLADEPTSALDVSLRAAEGEILGIIGESGSGKSTLLRQIACLERPDKGSILLEGREMTGRHTVEVCADIQMIFQNAARSFSPRMKIKTALNETLKRLGRLKGEALERRREELVCMVGLSPELAERYPAQLSGGQCQRMAIARALAAKPRLLLCDEVTSALDVSAQKQVVRLLGRLREELGLTVLFVSHDLALSSGICDRMLVMKEGQCVEEGTTEEIIRHPGHAYTQNLLEAVLSL